MSSNWSACSSNSADSNPDEAETEIQKLLGPQGSVITLPKSRQILVTETAGRLRAIRSVIERIESPEAGIAGRLQTFDLQFVLPNDALVILRQLLNIPAEQNVSADGSLRLAIDPSGERLLVTGTSDALTQIGEILKTIDVAGPGYVDEGPGTDEPQLRVYSIASADPTAVLAVIQTLLAGMPDVRLDLDAKTGNLIALARLAQHRTIEATLAEMQRDGRQVEVIRLYKVDPQLAVLSINKLFGIGGTDTAASAPQVDADLTTRQLLVRGTSAQIEQIRGLLTKMGESESADAAPPAGPTCGCCRSTGGPSCRRWIKCRKSGPRCARTRSASSLRRP